MLKVLHRGHFIAPPDMNNIYIYRYIHMCIYIYIYAAFAFVSKYDRKLMEDCFVLAMRKTY